MRTYAVRGDIRKQWSWRQWRHGFQLLASKCACGTVPRDGRVVSEGTPPSHQPAVLAGLEQSAARVAEGVLVVAAGSWRAAGEAAGVLAVGSDLVAAVAATVARAGKGEGVVEGVGDRRSARRHQRRACSHLQRR